MHVELEMWTARALIKCQRAYKAMFPNVKYIFNI